MAITPLRLTLRRDLSCRQAIEVFDAAYAYATLIDAAISSPGLALIRHFR